MRPVGSIVAHYAAPLSPAALAAARRYLYGALAWTVVEQVWLLAVLAGIFYFGWSRAWTAALSRRLRHAWLAAAASTAILFAMALTAMLPLTFTAGYLRERWYGFENLSPAAWLAQWAASTALTTLIGVIVAGIAWAWLRRRPSSRKWWLRLWAVTAVGVVLAVAADPIVFEPLFNHFTALRPGPVRTDIETLARAAGIPHARILEVNASRDSSHTNAYVTGILGTQRIVIYDTMLRQETPGEIEFVVGHEIGHYVLHHIWKGVAFTIALLLVLFAWLGWLYPKWSRGTAPSDIAGLPLVLLILVGTLYLLAPATNGFSRWEEHQADAFGLHLTRQVESPPADPCASAIASFQREEKTDLIYPNPPHWIIWWFFTHPSQQQRIDFIQRTCQPPPSN